jgi:hypothetical protein
MGPLTESRPGRRTPETQTGWRRRDLVREPEPLRSGDHLVFPDFAVYHRRSPARRILIEIVGFWTPRYLKNKLERLRVAGMSDAILCVDDSLNCAAEALPDRRHVIRFKRRIDAKAVLAIVEELLRRGAQVSRLAPRRTHDDVTEALGHVGIRFRQDPAPAARRSGGLSSALAPR